MGESSTEGTTGAGRTTTTMSMLETTTDATTTPDRPGTTEVEADGTIKMPFVVGQKGKKKKDRK